MLDKSFYYEKYNLVARLVTEDDAEFIVRLRSDKHLARYLHETHNDIEKQKKWIRDYKIREAEGLDYYFVYSKENMKIGVGRVYNFNLNKKAATTGSWICLPNLPLEYPIITFILGREILFEILKCDSDYFTVRKKNKKVIKIQEMIGAVRFNEDEDEYYYILRKEDFFLNREKLLRYIF